MVSDGTWRKERNLVIHPPITLAGTNAFRGIIFLPKLTLWAEGTPALWPFVYGEFFSAVYHLHCIPFPSLPSRSS